MYNIIEKIGLKRICFLILGLLVVIIIAAFFQTGDKTADNMTEDEANSKQLYENAVVLMQNDDPNSDTENEKQAVYCFRQILKDYPDSKEAKKASIMLNEISETHGKEILKSMEQMKLQSERHQPRVNKSKPLRSNR